MRRATIVRKAPESGGVYELTSFGDQRPLYIGRSRNLQERLLQHLAESNPNKFRFKKAGFLGSPAAMERKHFDRYVKKHGSIPLWNTQDPRKAARY